MKGRVVNKELAAEDKERVDSNGERTKNVAFGAALASSPRRNSEQKEYSKRQAKWHKSREDADLEVDLSSTKER